LGEEVSFGGGCFGRGSKGEGTPGKGTKGYSSTEWGEKGREYLFSWGEGGRKTFEGGVR